MYRLYSDLHCILYYRIVMYPEPRDHTIVQQNFSRNYFNCIWNHQDHRLFFKRSVLSGISVWFCLWPFSDRAGNYHFMYWFQIQGIITSDSTGYINPDRQSSEHSDSTWFKKIRIILMEVYSHTFHISRYFGSNRDSEKYTHTCRLCPSGRRWYEALHCNDHCPDTWLSLPWW